jgi:hypothetical protein
MSWSKWLQSCICILAIQTIVSSPPGNEGQDFTWAMALTSLSFAIQFIFANHISLNTIQSELLKVLLNKPPINIIFSYSGTVNLLHCAITLAINALMSTCKQKSLANPS